MNNKDLLKQYVTIGQALPYDQFLKIREIPSLYKSYMRSRNIAVEQGDDYAIYELDQKERLELTYLDFSDKNLTLIPQEEILLAPNIKILDLAANNISEIPSWISEMQNLEFIDLSDNNFTGIPESIKYLNNLKFINFSGNGIEQENMSTEEISYLKKLLPNFNIALYGVKKQIGMYGTRYISNNFAIKNPTIII
jgi:Leucine-rich repeat (LRR) protein